MIHVRVYYMLIYQNNPCAQLEIKHINKLDMPELNRYIKYRFMIAKQNTSIHLGGINRDSKTGAKLVSYLYHGKRFA